MPPAPRAKLQAILMRGGLLDTHDVAEVEKSQQPDERFADAVVRLKLATEEKIAEVVAQHYGLPFLRLVSASFDPAALAHFTEEQATQFRAIPVALEDDVITLAVCDPLDWSAKQAVEFRGLKTRLAVSTPTAIRDAIQQQYRTEESLDSILKDVSDPGDLEFIASKSDDTVESAETSGVLDLWKQESKPVVKAVNLILREAVDRAASDVHIEPGVSFLRVRLRIDGVLEEAMRLPKWMQAVVVARIKILAGLDIAERRVPQDGRFRLKHGKKDIDLRISTLPSHYGEKVVARLLDSERSVAKLETLGFEASQMAAIRAAVERPQGLMLVTGPTGSGKSSTLNAAIRELIGKPINIVTIENPIEYEIQGVTQVQVNEKAGLTFAATLRSILRQDPNVILLGEIRDKETAEVALQASMTGHLVLSTLHTNDAPSAVSRLFDLGVAPFLVSSSLAVVVAQRLVRRTCEHCRVPDRPPPEDLQRLGLQERGVYQRGVGCDRCRKTGYSGRMVVAEVLSVDARTRDLIVRREPESAYRKAMRASNTPSIAEDAARKIRLGFTTVAEVLRVVEVDAQAELCRRCGEPIESDFAACPACGESLRVSCSECRQPLRPDWSICPYCRAPVEKSQAPPLGERADIALKKAASATATESNDAGQRFAGKSFEDLMRADDEDTALPEGWIESAGVAMVPSAAPAPAPAPAPEPTVTSVAAAARPASGPGETQGIVAASAGTERKSGAATAATKLSATDALMPELGLSQGIKVLVVDDDPDIRRLLTLFLRRVRVPTTVRTATNGREALEMIAQDPPALVLLDIMMPEVDGFEVCRRLRSDLKTAFIPVIMLTASREQESRATAFAVGTDDWVPKPIDPLDFQGRVERLIARTYGI